MDIKYVAPTKFYGFILKLLGGIMVQTSISDIPYEAIKITSSTIYVYESVTLGQNNRPILGPERIIYKDDSGNINVDNLFYYIFNQIRFRLCAEDIEDNEGKKKKEWFIRLLQVKKSTETITPEVESEKQRLSAIYVLKRDLYFMDSVRGKALIKKLNMDLSDPSESDAKPYIVECQLNDKSDQYILSLLMNNCREGRWDKYTGTVYGKEKSSGVYKEIKPVKALEVQMDKAISFSQLGFNVRRTSMRTFTSAGGGMDTERVIHFELPLLKVSKDMSRIFKSIREETKGIIFINDALPDDVLSVIYPVNEFSKPKDVLYYSQQVLANDNFNMQVMSFPNFEHAEEVICGLTYDIYILDNLQLCSKVIDKADSSLIFILGQFKDVQDLYQKIRNHPSGSKIINYLIGIADFGKKQYLKVCDSIRSAMLQSDLCFISKLKLSDYITLKGDIMSALPDKQSTSITGSFSNFILEQLKNVSVNRIEIYKKHITIYVDGVPRIINTRLQTGDFIFLIQKLTSSNFYKELKEQERMVFTYKNSNASFKVLITMDELSFTIVIKRNTFQLKSIKNIIDPPTAEGLALIADSPSGSTYGLNGMLADLCAEYAKTGKKILMIDKGYGISSDTFPGELASNINISRATSIEVFTSLVTIMKPDILIYNKVDSLELFLSLLHLVPLVKTLIITTRYMNPSDLIMHFGSSEVKRLLSIYLKDCFIYASHLQKWKTATIDTSIL